MNAFFTELVAAGLEALFNHDARAHKLRAGGQDEGGKPFQSAAVRQKIVDQKNPVVGGEEFFGNDDVVNASVGKGFYLCREYVARDVLGLRLFGKDDGNVEIRNLDARLFDAGDADAGRLDREDLVYACVGEAAVKFLADLFK